MHKDVKALVRRLRKAGCDVAYGKSHLRILDANGRRIATVAATPSDPRSLKNAISEIRKAGIEI